MNKRIAVFALLLYSITLLPCTESVCSGHDEDQTACCQDSELCKFMQCGEDDKIETSCITKDASAPSICTETEVNKCSAGCKAYTNQTECCADAACQYRECPGASEPDTTPTCLAVADDAPEGCTDTDNACVPVDECSEFAKEACCDKDACKFIKCSDEDDGACMANDGVPEGECANKNTTCKRDECIDLDEDACCDNEACKFVKCSDDADGACMANDGVPEGECANKNTTCKPDECKTLGEDACCDKEACKFVKCSDDDDGACMASDATPVGQCENTNTTCKSDECQTLDDEGACCSNEACKFVKCSADKKGECMVSTATPVDECENKDSTCDPCALIGEEEDCCKNENCQFKKCPAGDKCMAAVMADDQMPGCEDQTDTCTKAPEPKPKASGDDDKSGQSFDAASFIGGIVLTAGLVVIAFAGYKFYKRRHPENRYSQF